MKKKILSGLKRLPGMMLVLFVLALFLSSFVSLQTENIAVFESYPAQYVGSKYVEEIQKPKSSLRDYDWYYEIHFVHFKNGRVDTLIMAPGAEKVILDSVLYTEYTTKVMDNFMVNYEKGIFYGDWARTAKEEPKDKRHRIALRNLSEFKPEKQFAMTLPLVVKKKSKTEEYFDVMREVSKSVDRHLEMELKRPPIFSPADRIFSLRKGKPKLGSFLAYATYRTFSDNYYGTEVFCSIPEANALELYPTNWIIDNKMMEIPRGELALSAFRFQMAQRRFINCLPVSANKQDLVFKKLWYSNAASFEGQMIDMEQLRVDRIDKFSLEDGDFQNLYRIRCQKLNIPYGFSAWLGGHCSGVPEESFDGAWYAGVYLGAGLQGLNDLHDISPANSDRGKDIENGILTLPVFLSLKGYPYPDIAWEVRKESFAYYEKALYHLKDFPNNRGKEFLEQAASILVTSKLLT